MALERSGWVLLCFLAFLDASAVSGQEDPVNMVSYDEKFALGMKKYAQGRWSDVIAYIGQAMEEYKKLELARLECFEKCEDQDTTITSEFSAEPEYRFFFTVIEKAHCIKSCKENMLGLVPWGGVSSILLDKLKKKEGLNFLQMALWKEGKTREAARTSATYDYYHPRNIHIKNNMKYYKSLKEVTEEDLVTMETVQYRELFSRGHQLYYAAEWQKMVSALEDSLDHFFKAFDECRTLCNGPLKYNAILDFAQAVSKIHLDKLACRVQCVRELGEFRSDRYEDFFGTYFHYLQHGYHHMNQSLLALQASAAQVKLEPGRKTAERNSVFYLRQPGVTRKNFFPNEKYLPEITKRERDLNLSRIFTKLFGKFSDEEEWKSQNEESGRDEVLLEEDFQNFPVGNHPLTVDNIEPVVVQTSADYNGVERMVVDDLLTQQQCQDLMNLASYGREGDGYQSKTPHTLREKFEGLHILDAAKKTMAGEVDKYLTWLYLNSSIISKDLVAKQFELKNPLYFSYTHLVCRTSLEDKQDGRDDLSHPVHSDNCILNEATGDCDKVPPAYTWRDYSAILYLNDDFEGGDFFFAHSVKDLSPAVRVRPKCGRLVGFSAGKENMHGVMGVTKGRRCAVALWFTSDVNHKEAAFDAAAETMAGQ